MGFESVDSNAVAAAAVSEATEKIVHEFAFVEGLMNTGLNYVQTYAWQLVAAAIIVIAGLFFSSWTKKLIIRAGTKHGKIDPTLLNFLAGVAKIVVLGFTILITLSKLGITIAPLIAALSAGVFGMTFALQAPVANYAAGLSIILSRPFKLGDLISLHGKSGRVESITLAMTYLRDSEGELIQIPNKKIIGEIIENSAERRLIEGSVGVGYDSDPQKAIQLIESVINQIIAVDHESSVNVGINSFGESSIELSWRCMVPVDQYLSMKFQINGEVFRVLKEASIEIPYPHRVVTIAKGSVALS